MTWRRNRARGVHFPILAAAVLPALAFAVLTAHGKERLTPEFISGQGRPISLVLLPPKAELVKQKFISVESMVGESEAFEKSVTVHIVRHLQDKGYTVKVLSPDQINLDAALQDLVLRVERRYAEELQRLGQKPKKLEERRYTLGEDARLLAATLGTGGLLFARVGALHAMAMGGSFAHLSVSVVNGVNGDLEAHFYSIESTSRKSLLENTNTLMNTLVDKVLENYPGSGGGGAVASAQGTGKTQGKTDEAVLAEAQALLGVQPSTQQVHASPQREAPMTSQAKAVEQTSLPARPPETQPAPAPQATMQQPVQVAKAESAYKVGIFPAVGQFIPRPNSGWDEAYTAQRFRAQAATNSSLKVMYSHYEEGLDHPRLYDASKLWAGQKLKLSVIYKEARARNLDVVFLYRGTGFYVGYTEKVTGPMPIELYLIDVKQERVYQRKGTTDGLQPMIGQLVSDLVQGRPPS